MKRFLDNKTVIAQSLIDQGLELFGQGGQIIERYTKPQDAESKMKATLDEQTDQQRVENFDRAEDDLRKIIVNENEARSIFKQNNNNDYDGEKKHFFDVYSVPPLQFNNFIIDLWPMVRDKNISFNKFLKILSEIAFRYGGSPQNINNFFKSFISVLPNLEKTLGTSDEVIDKAVSFLTSGKSAKEFQDYLLYQTLIRYGLFNEIPDSKVKNNILEATQALESVRADINPVEQEYLDFLRAKHTFLKEMSEVYQDVTLAMMQMQKKNYADIVGLFKNGLNTETMKFYLENLRKGMKFGELQRSMPFGNNKNPQLQGSRTDKSTSHISDTVRRKVFAFSGAPYDVRDEFTSGSGMTSEPRPSAPPATPKDPTDSKEFSTIYGRFIVDINEFESTTTSLSKRVDEQIAYIVNKSSSSQQVGPFSAGNVFQYLQDDEESLKESDRILNLIDQIISSASSLRNSLIEKISSTNITGSRELRQKQTAITAIDEKFGIFEKDMQSKQLGLKFNKVLIENQNEYSEAQDAYDNLKIEMESNVSARPVLAPKAILAGFKMADILETISNKFNQIAALNPLRSEQAHKTSRRWQNFAKQQRAHVFTEIFPGLSQSIGIEATKPSISPSFSLRAAFVDIDQNLRLGSKFMDKEVESDKEFRDYWNNLFMQSKDPRPMGDIIEEKPKHGNLTTEEDAKLHKNTMRKFKKPVSKKPRFKKK
jgi:hypothetical protein